MSKTISMHGNLRLVGALVLNNADNIFPDNPQEGTILIKGTDLYAYIDVKGVKTWYPIIRGTTSTYVQDETTPSNFWIVNHNLSSTDIWFQFKDLSGHVIDPVTVDYTNANSFTASFAAPFSGTVVVVASSVIDVQSIKTEVIDMGSNTIISPNSMTINGVPVLAPVSGTNIKTINGQSVLGSGDIVISGGTGSSTPSQTKSFNTVSRYFMDTTPGQTVQCVSSATVVSNLSWSRSETVLTINHTGHGRSVGDRVIIRNTSVDNLITLITSLTEDSFSVNCQDSGEVSGALGAYSCGFKFAHDAAQGSIANGTLSMPANTDIQLLSLRTHLKSNSRIATNYVFYMPKEAITGLGGSNDIDSCYIPNQQIRQDADTLIAVANTVATNITGSYAAFRLAALPALTTGIIITLQF